MTAHAHREHTSGTTTDRASGTTTDRASGTTTDRASGTTTDRASGTTTDRAARAPSARGAALAFRLLRTVFTVAPIAFGLDKFAEILTHWERYLAPQFNNLIPGTAHQAMLVIGVVEVAAGVLVAVRPHLGGYVVAGWLAGIIVNLLLIGGYADIALRDFGLLVGALALAQLAAPSPSPSPSPSASSAAPRSSGR